MEPTVISIAVLDMYDNMPNEGMRGIMSILHNQTTLNPAIQFQFKRFDVRFKNEIPDLSYDIYISSGGPGSPLYDANAAWEKEYFNLIQNIIDYNLNNDLKKHVFFICHSFQLACRFFEIGTITKRNSTAFGIFPMHLTENASNESCFANLQDPFYAVDSRDYQVVQPNHDHIKNIGATILAIEKDRPHVPYERAIMSIRFNNEMIGTQFHPEADPTGMLNYLYREDKKDHIIQHYGENKYLDMLSHLNDDDKIKLTQNTIIPNFLRLAIDHHLHFMVNA